MKRILLFLLLLCPAAVVRAAAADSLNAPLVTYFLCALKGHPYATDFHRPLRADEVPAARAEVWRAWRQALSEYTECPLPPVRPLAECEAASWPLPDSLEHAAEMPFYFGSKGDSVPAAGRPLFLYLHGSGSPEQEWGTGLRICQQFDDAPSLYFIPRIPNGRGELYRWWHRSKQYAWEQLFRRAMADSAVDPNRLYCFGISEGGYGSQRLAAFYADYLAAAGPMAGGEPLENAPAENLGHIGFSLLTGDRDRTFGRNRLTRRTRQVLDSLQKCRPEPFAHRVRLIPAHAHAIDYSPTTPYLKDFRRNPCPKTFRWENFEMDGRKRNAFYNIAVAEPADSLGRRTDYDFSIASNRLQLRVSHVSYAVGERESQWGIPILFHKTYEPAPHGHVTVYLDDRLADLSRRVTFQVNDQPPHRSRLALDFATIVESCLRYGDPERLFPAKMELDW